MARRSYTPQQKADAVALYATNGPAAVLERYGIPKPTVVGWARANGVRTFATEQTRAATEAATVKWAERRTAMIDDMGRVAAKALSVAGEMLEAGTTSKAKDATLTLAILVDKAQLLAGAATSRHEVIADRTPEAEADLARVLHLRAVA